MAEYTGLLEYFNVTLKNILNYPEHYGMIITEDQNSLIIHPTVAYVNSPSLIGLLKLNQELFTAIESQVIQYFKLKGIFKVKVSLNGIFTIRINMNPDCICYLEGVPNEILGEIGDHLSLGDIINFYMINKRSYELITDSWWNLQFKKRYLPLFKLDATKGKYDYKVITKDMYLINKTNEYMSVLNSINIPQIFSVIDIYHNAISNSIKVELLRFLVCENLIGSFSYSEITTIIYMNLYDIFEYIVDNFILSLQKKERSSYFASIFSYIIDKSDVSRYLSLILSYLKNEDIIDFCDDDISDENFSILITHPNINRVSLSEIKRLSYSQQNRLYDLVKDEATFEQLINFINYKNLVLSYKVYHHPLVEQTIGDKSEAALEDLNLIWIKDEYNTDSNSDSDVD